MTRIRLDRVRTGASLAAAGCAGAVVGTLVLAGLARRFVKPAVFLTGGFAAFAFSTSGLIAVLSGPDVPPRSRLRRITVVVTVGAGLFSATVLIPNGRDPHSPAPVAGVHEATLRTGSRLAFAMRRAAGAPTRTPVVFVHGGPGVPDLMGDIDYFGRLAADGHDVYVYDQVGSGRSARLDDPTHYTVERHVSDLEALRRHIGAESMILIAHSAGAEIASTYLADHPARVDKLVLISPAAMPGSGDHSGDRYLNSLPFRRKLSVLRDIAWPRVMAAYGLLQISPRAAHNLVGDREMDARFDHVYNDSRAVLHCPDRDPGPALHDLGFYANQYPQSASARTPRDVRAELAGNTTPTLVLKGECDYLSWSSATDYLGTLAECRLVYVEDAGHNVYQDQPEQVLGVLRAFLAGEPLSARTQPGEVAPDSYRGPR